MIALNRAKRDKFVPNGTKRRNAQTLGNTKKPLISSGFKNGGRYKTRTCEQKAIPIGAQWVHFLVVKLAVKHHSVEIASACFLFP